MRKFPNTTQWPIGELGFQLRQLLTAGCTLRRREWPTVKGSREIQREKPEIEFWILQLEGNHHRVHFTTSRLEGRGEEADM